MEKIIYIALIVAIVVMICLSIHFFVIDILQKKDRKFLQEEVNELKKRVLKLEKSDVAHGREYGRENKKSNRITKRN